MQENRADLSQIEKRRSNVVQFLMMVVSALQAIVLFSILSNDPRLSVVVPAIVLVLLACLYAGFRERQLRHQQAALRATAVARGRQLSKMSEKMRADSTALEQLGERLDDVTALYRAISTVNSVREPGATYDAMLRAGLALIDADRGSIMLADSRGELRIEVAEGLPPSVLRQTHAQAPGEGIAGSVLVNGEGVLIEGSAEGDPRFSRVISNAQELRSALSVPLISFGRVLGVLNLGLSSESTRDQLGESDLSLANIFAQHAAVALGGVLLLEEQMAEAETGELRRSA